MSKDIRKIKANEIDAYGNLKPKKNTKKNTVTANKSVKTKAAKKKEIKVYTGKFISNNKGFGFVEVEELDEDLFIPKDQCGDAFHFDIVEAVVTKEKTGDGKRIEAKIIRIIERGIEEVVGTFQKSQNFGFVVPDNAKIAYDIFVPKEKSKGAMDGHKVVCKIYDYGRGGRNPEGEITEIIGHISDPGVDILSIVRGYDIPMEFPVKVMNQAERVGLEISEADTYGREDYRDIKMVTIDGEDAKDLDDAVSLTVKNDEYVLGVHIADVANYVQESSALDREAYERGTSVYLVDRVIPMLPRRLSNGICSLNQGEDRLAMSCVMTINNEGEVVNYKIVESVINVNRRMSYNQVKAILVDEDKDLCREYKDFVPMFKDMEKLAAILREKRMKRGSIDFDLPESKILLDENGKPVSIKPYEHNVATKIIEDFMLIANETVAGHMYWQDNPFLYRVHDTPDMEKIERLTTLIKNFGFYLKGDKDSIHPKEIQKLLSQIAGRDEENLISRITLRSMMMARYSPECTGHFGLAAKEYCHFTSPIRRYPDLQIHRILKDEIRGRLEKKKSHYSQILSDVAKQCSDREKRAKEAERETDKLKKAEYMSEHIGETFEGVISSVTNFGMYVELPNTVEGLVHISKIENDFYYFDEQHYELVGERTKKKYRLGERIAVTVDNVDMTLKTIDFVIAENGDKEE